MIAKALSAKKSKTPFVCRGSGKPVRQFCYAPGIDITISLTICLLTFFSLFVSVDLAKVIIWALDAYNEEAPLNIAGPEISIRELSEKIASLVGLESGVVYDLSYCDGPLKRTVSVDRLNSLWPEFVPTDFTAALATIITGLKF